ncbi:interleukin-9 receptor-like isoform X1 [Anas platyrhynchos]|uniref:Fibronectin type-III domain-containing protein n=3 Tax=Anas platyrhynchos TaxID=8839 RepID=A0A493TD62_ANAPP|nr:interleukin-9 receptor-like isoform X1 [Anas platyrhynchos]|eukprot:XP_005018691.1 interleukin-9 receptor-like isoform X1 [Anas platyrhynchos]
MPLLLLPDHQTTQPKLSRDRNSVKSEVSFELVLSGMGQDVQQLGLHLCITAVLLLGRGQGREFPGSLSCLNNYVTTVNCMWAMEEPVGDGPFYLHFTNLWSKGQNASCQLTARDSMQKQYHCTIHLASQILETDGYRVSLQGNFFGSNHTYITFPEYNPRKHIKLDPPLNIQSNITASKCQIWWSVPWYLVEILQYELQYKEYSVSWEFALNKTPPSSLPQIEIEGTEFHSGVSYIARVRCKVSENEDSYHSQWSEWSQTTVFQRAEVSEKLFSSRTLQFLFIPLSFGTLLYLFWNCKLPSRAKSLSCFNIPTPAAFFQPLYNLHNGNFKDWVGPNEAWNQLRREEASNSNKVTTDGVSELNTQEFISQISLKPVESTNLVAAEEMLASGPSQQYVPSRYVRAEEMEVQLALFLAQNHADDTVGLKISEIIKANLDRSSMGRSCPSHLQHGKGDFLMLLESLEMANVSFSNSDYCTLCDNDTTGGLIAAELLKLSDGDGLVKHQNDQNGLP